MGVGQRVSENGGGLPANEGGAAAKVSVVVFLTANPYDLTDRVTNATSATTAPAVQADTPDVKFW